MLLLLQLSMHRMVDTRESIDSIKFNAPKYYSSQNRAATAEDYKVILLSYIRM